MKVRELWTRLETLGGAPEEATAAEVAEAAADMLDIVTPGIEFLAGLHKRLQDAGLTEASVNKFMDAVVDSIVEGMG